MNVPLILVASDGFTVCARMCLSFGGSKYKAMPASAWTSHSLALSKKAAALLLQAGAPLILFRDCICAHMRP